MMKMLILLGLMVGSAVMLASAFRRRGRSFHQFDGMVTCFTNNSVLYDYFYYGCWCGYGGSGDPVDDTDMCCKTYADCYDSLVNEGSCSTTDLHEKEYLFAYEDCYTNSASAVCGPGDECQVGMCSCDLAVAMCFREAVYNPDFNYFDRDNLC